MSITRRKFAIGLGVGGASLALFGCRGTGGPSEGSAGSAGGGTGAEGRPIPLHNNENPLGPSDRAVQAMRTTLGDGAAVGRYPFGYTGDLTEAVANEIGVGADNVMIGNGSTQLLRTVTHVCTSPTRPLVQGSLTYEECAGYAGLVDHPMVLVPLNDEMKLDLDAMADAAADAGLVFVVNPNNPTATVHGEDAMGAFIDRVLSESDEARVVVDEAYHDYVTEPSYRTQVALAVENPRVLVARTFSKAHGMAGLRVGYLVGHPDTLREMRRWHHGLSLNVPSLVGARASIGDRARIEQERERNTGVRQFTLDWFRDRGFEATDSQTNFIFVRTGMPASEFRAACRERGILVGRDFPPFAETHARISIGTREEMETATAAFGEILAERIETTEAAAMAAARQSGRQTARAA